MMPESMKDSRLRQLKQQNPLVHSAVRAALDRQRNDTRRQAGDQVIAQQQQQQVKAGGHGPQGLIALRRILDRKAV